MRAKEWLAVSSGILFVGAAPAWLVWYKIAAAIDDRPVARIVDVLKIAPGQKIADAGSSEWPFIFPPAERTGETGVVYAVAINPKAPRPKALRPKALRKVERLAQKRGEGQCLA
jgi:hypothetical protein